MTAMIYHGKGVDCPSGLSHPLSQPCSTTSVATEAPVVPDVPEPPAEEEVPQWFIAWRASQYNADLLDLVDRQQRLKVQMTDIVTRLRQEWTRMEADLHRHVGRFVLTEEAQADIERENRIDKLRAELRELDPDYDY
jgi:hypothetical protein